jgi:3-phenylpropionate/trans-cinnamate dioxygenase ferredoxin component
MTDFVKIAKTTDLPDPGKQVYEIEDSVVVLFHVGGQFYCLNDVCTHDGGPLGEGHLCGHAIACPRHALFSPPHPPPPDTAPSSTSVPGLR